MTVIPDLDIQAALNYELELLFPTTPVAWENAEYAPTLGTSYLRAYMLPAETDIVTLGPGPWQERRGIFQVDAVHPKGKGWGSAKAKAAAVVQAFHAGHEIIYNSLRIVIEKSWPSSGIPEDAWYRVPVNIVYCCYANQ